MATPFSSVSVRSNADSNNPVEASWWNDLRTAGILLEAALGGGFDPGSIDVPIANTQINTTTGLTVSQLYKMTEIRYAIRRKTDTQTKMQSGVLVVLYDGTAFSIYEKSIQGCAGNAGVPVSFGIDDTLGILYYSSDTLTGVYDTAHSEMDYILTTMGAV